MKWMLLLPLLLAGCIDANTSANLVNGTKDRGYLGKVGPVMLYIIDLPNGKCVLVADRYTGGVALLETPCP